MATPYTVCCVTVDDKAAAKALAEGLVSGRLAACVSVLPGVSSTYRWMGRLERAEESLLLIKTRKSLKGPLRRFVTDNHPAKVPEVI
ncbi:MAG TPA: divalent-cation tolerance protein CutA, partial [Elusimicrobiales bacterium]|nr:divalent-cation tolerance protein CutA [Elusimicrobiales bacterium]